MRYVDGKPHSIDTVVLSQPARARVQPGRQDEADAFYEAVRRGDHQAGAAGKEWLKDTKYLINPTGRFVVGGPQGDCGLTGRKIIVDTYGGACPHGGGAFSGKDPSKVDRSAAYAARYVAKNVVAAGLAKQCQIQVAYAIGVARPMNVTVYTEGTGVMPDDKIAKLVNEHFDLRPKGIIQMLDLLRPIYEKTAAYGHFGREEPEFTWDASHCPRPSCGSWAAAPRLQLLDASGQPLALEAKLDFAGSTVDPRLGTVPMRAELPNADGRLLPGQTVRVQLKLGEQPGFLLPQAAVLNGEQGRFVWLMKEGKATPQPVQTGGWQGDQWVIRSGLSGGDRVITDNLLKLHPGAAVAAAAPASAASAASAGAAP
jgi:hypothetical protein